MFKKIKKWIKRRIEARKRVSGLSKGLTVVDNYMIPGLTVRKLDQNYGRAYESLNALHVFGEISADELGAAMATLKEQYRRLRHEAKYAERYA